ncbi:MAG: 3-dehydroquinate synthase [Hyphomicrobiales bacterium]
MSLPAALEGDGAVTVPVSLGERSYDIVIGERLLRGAGRLIAPVLRRPFAAVVTDETVAALHLPTLEHALAASGIAVKTVTVPAGESSKSYARLAEVCDGLLKAGVERSDMVIALGGGVIGDLAGFAAAILRRGVDFIQIPTTLLAQVDSSVGGKTGINSPHGKNLIGAFHQPRLVLADTTLLDTLPDRQRRAGYAEVVKYGLLGDAPFFAWLEANGARVLAGDPAARIKAIETSCRAKAAIVAEDETETGVRALLNLGHTFGHALEAATGYGERLLHGEGVAIGMAMAFRFSQRLGLCAPEAVARVERHLAASGLPTNLHALHNALPGAEGLLDYMRQDKKAKAGQLTFILVRGIGEAFIAKGVPDADVLAFLGAELGSR